MNLRNLLPRQARCAFVDRSQRQCPHHIGWIARLLGAIHCLQHKELPDLD